MPHCPSCGAEFRAGFTHCNTCQVPLVASLEAEDEGPGGAVEIDESALRLLSHFNEEAQAALVRRLLDEAGVPSVLQGGHAQSVGGCEPYRLLVDEDYIDAAQETVEAARSPSLVTGQIEGILGRLQDGLRQVGRERSRLAPQVQAVEASLERLQADLRTLNREIEKEE